MKLGILGTGMIAREFLTITPFLKGIEVTAICNVRNGAAAIDLANNYKIKNAFCQYDEFLKSEVTTVYIALPNNLHYQFAKEALEAGKNVIVEKPFTTNYKEAVILSELARKKQLFLFEAINNQYLPNYKKIKAMLTTLGNIKIVLCNFSQYSSRYNRFKEGEVLPAFDPKCSGGALMDLNIYNIHYVVGLFGKPKNVDYYPNIERGIDTSGILIMDYEKFKCSCIGAKDCKAPIANNIQGDNGCIYQNTPTNVCGSFEMLMNDGTSTIIDENVYEHRMVNEFLEFEDMIINNKLEKCYQMLEHSLLVCEVQTIARKKAGIIFQSDFVQGS
jgi:predicted dehydrogenase